jgi:hypothetical protein
MGADEIVRLHEIDSRLFVSIYREFQHGRQENVRKNPERPAERREKYIADDRGGARQCFVDYKKDIGRPVEFESVSLSMTWRTPT